MRAGWSLFFSLAAGTKSIIDRKRASHAHKLRETGRGYRKRGKTFTAAEILIQPM